MRKGDDIQVLVFVYVNCWVLRRLMTFASSQFASKYWNRLGRTLIKKIQVCRAGIFLCTFAIFNVCD